MKKTVLGAVTFLVDSRPCTTGLATAIAGIVAWSLVTAPPPDAAARTEPRVAQLESQVVQLEALILRSATTLEKSLSTQVQSDRADITTAAMNTAGTLVSHLKAAGSPTLTTGSSTSPITPPATTIQHAANAALATTTNPITTIVQQIEQTITNLAFWALFFIVGAGLLIAKFLGFECTAGVCHFVGWNPPVGAPAASSGATTSEVETKPVVNKFARLITTTVNTVKARTVAPKRTLTPKPLSSAVKSGPVVGKPQVSRNEPSAHSGSLRTGVKSMTSNLSNAVKHAIGTIRSKKAQNSPATP
jgi:hypothetical protein